jgi:hypothetical protein
MAVETPAKPSITLEEAIIQMSANIDKNIAEMTRRMAESKKEADAEAAKIREEAAAPVPAVLYKSQNLKIFLRRSFRLKKILTF